MVRASVVASISLAFFVGCGKQPSGLDAGETHTDETQSSLGEGNDDGDGDPVLLDPCDWVPVPASACSTPFEPAPAELPPPAMAESGVFSEVDIIAHADRVEVLWTRGYSIDNEHVEERRYVSSNVQGAWQHEFLITAPYEFVSAPYLFSPQIDGSPSRTQVRPPYMRRENGQWQLPILDGQTDPLAKDAYQDPRYFVVGPDDRSYLMTDSQSQPTILSIWVLAETDNGCHVPTWQLELADDCDRQPADSLGGYFIQSS